MGTILFSSYRQCVYEEKSIGTKSQDLPGQNTHFFSINPFFKTECFFSYFVSGEHKNFL